LAGTFVLLLIYAINAGVFGNRELLFGNWKVWLGRPESSVARAQNVSPPSQASLDVVMLSCPLFCLLQFVESGVNMLYSVAAPLTTGVLKLTFCSSY